MAVPLGVRKNFFNLGSQEADEVLTGDYCHKKASTIKVKGSSKAGGAFNFKRSWTKKQEGGMAYSDEFKVGHPILGQVYHQMRVDRKGVFKSHFDLGDYSWLGSLRNVQAVLKYDTGKQTAWLRLANSHKSEHCESHQRLELRPDGQVDWSMRTNLILGKVLFSFAAIYGVSTSTLTKYDWAATRMLNDHVQLAIKHTTPKKGLLGKFMVGLSCRPEQGVQAALAAYINKQTGKRRYVAGITKEIGSHRVRAKVDQNGKMSMAGMVRLGKGVNLTMGSQVAMNQNQSSLPMGYTLDLSL